MQRSFLSDEGRIHEKNDQTPVAVADFGIQALVRLGRASVFIRRARSQKVIEAWDHATGIICVHEAGGKMTDLKGSELDVATDEVERRIIYLAGGVLVTDGSIHNQLLVMISSNSTNLRR